MPIPESDLRLVVGGTGASFAALAATSGLLGPSFVRYSPILIRERPGTLDDDPAPPTPRVLDEDDATLVDVEAPTLPRIPLSPR